MNSCTHWFFVLFFLFEGGCCLKVFPNISKPSSDGWMIQGMMAWYRTKLNMHVKTNNNWAMRGWDHCFFFSQVSVGDEILPSFVGIIVNYCKDPYSTTSIMESIRFFFLFFNWKSLMINEFSTCWCPMANWPVITLQQIKIDIFKDR